MVEYTGVFAFAGLYPQCEIVICGFTTHFQVREGSLPRPMKTVSMIRLFMIYTHPSSRCDGHPMCRNSQLGRLDKEHRTTRPVTPGE